MQKFSKITPHPADQIIEIIRRIYMRGLTTSTGGNISIQDNEGNIWVTPSAIDKGSLQRSDIICIKCDGKLIGHHKPSSEFPFHQAIYRTRQDIKSVIHVHSPALVSFSMVRQIPNINIIPQARQICGPIGYAPYAISGSEELGNNIALEFQKGSNALIMENHGSVIGGTDIKDAYTRFETLEFAASTLLGTYSMGTPFFLSNAQIELYESQSNCDLPELEKASYSSDEVLIRSEMSKMLRRACNQGLMISSFGSVSVRLTGNNFLITPRNISRWEIGLEDIIQIKESRREPGKLPDKSVNIHQEIYRSNPHINSIIITQTPNIMAFGVSPQKMDVRSIPESWIFLPEIPVLPFGAQFSENINMRSVLIKNTASVSIIRNDSVIATGNSLQRSYDMLEAAEFSAKYLILCKSIGAPVPLSPDQILEIEEKFL